MGWTSAAVASRTSMPSAAMDASSHRLKARAPPPME
jgi:hypothetical protein